MSTLPPPFPLLLSSVAGPAVGQTGEKPGETSQARPEPLGPPLCLLRGALLLPLGPRHAGRPLRPLPPGSAGGHRLHAGACGGLGRSGQPVAAAPGQALCDRCVFRTGHGLLPVLPGGAAVGDLGLSAPPAAGTFERETLQGLRQTVGGRLETLSFTEGVWRNVLCV